MAICKKIINKKTFEVYPSLKEAAKKLKISVPTLYEGINIYQNSKYKNYMYLDEWLYETEKNKNTRNFYFWNVWENCDER